MPKKKGPGCPECRCHLAAIKEVQEYCKASMVDPKKPAQGFEGLLRIFLQAILEIIDKNLK